MIVLISFSENGMKISFMELLSKSGRVVPVSGGSTNMGRKKVT